jgi:hypothetical protein
MTGDRNSPATKGDLVDLKAEVIAAMLEGQMKLFKALYSFADTVQGRYRGSDDFEADLKPRLATIEARILEVEMRLNRPPDAA